jgi:hypothetical protein
MGLAQLIEYKNLIKAVTMGIYGNTLSSTNI